MLLSDYLAQTQNLLQYPGSATSGLYTQPNLFSYINIARTQVAAEGECARRYTSLAVTTTANQWPLSAVVLTPGTSATFKVNQMWRLNTGLGPFTQTLLEARSFEWLSTYYSLVVAPSGPPKVWAPYNQGTMGSIFIAPTPDATYSLPVDAVVLPSPLSAPSDAETVIPGIWDVAVPYFAAYLALLGAQMQARAADAQRMLTLYETFMERARRFATPQVLPANYSQVPNQVQANQLGLQKAAG